MDIKTVTYKNGFRPPEGAGLYILNPNTKALNLSSLTGDNFAELLGTNGGLEQLHASVAYLYAAYDSIASAVSRLPIDLVGKGGDVVPFKNFPVNMDLSDLLYRSILSLKIHGVAYMMKEQLTRRRASLRWLDPVTIEPLVDERRGLYAFRRNLSQGGGMYLVENNLSPILWVWLRGLRETSPGVSPSRVIRFAAELLRNIDIQSSEFYESGAVPITLVEVPDSMEAADMKRIESRWRRTINLIAPRENKPVRAINRSVKIHTLSFAPKDLNNATLEDSKRRDLAVATKTAEYILTGVSANVGTSENTRQHWMENTVLPDADLILGEMNRQLANPLGYEFVIAEDRIDIFQKQKLARAEAMTALAGGPIYEVNEVREMVGAEPLPYGNFMHEVNPPTQQAVTEPDSTEPVDSQSVKSAEITRLRRWAKKRRNPRASGFSSDILTPDEIGTEIRNIKSPRIIPDGKPLPPVPADFAVTERDIENAIQQWDDTMLDYAGLLDADATSTESEGQ